MNEPKGIYIGCTSCDATFRAEVASEEAPKAYPPCPACGAPLDEFLCLPPEDSGIFPNLWLVVGRQRDGTVDR